MYSRTENTRIFLIRRHREIIPAGCSKQKRHNGIEEAPSRFSDIQSQRLPFKSPKINEKEELNHLNIVFFSIVNVAYYLPYELLSGLVILYIILILNY